MIKSCLVPFNFRVMIKKKKFNEESKMEFFIYNYNLKQTYMNPYIFCHINITNHVTIPDKNQFFFSSHAFIQDISGACDTLTVFLKLLQILRLLYTMNFT